VLGPTIFNLYVNDLYQCVKYCDVYKYADDLQLIFSCPVTDVKSGVAHVD
jgi:hypothetical protein